jgi:TIR domain
MPETLTRASLKVFLSYSHTDREAVHALWARLEKDGFDVWLDKENLKPGQNWEYEIRNAILRSDIVLVCLSQNFNHQPGFRHEELKIALKKAESLPNNEIFIIPVRLEECDMPGALKHLHRVDLFDEDGYKKLVCTLGEQAGLLNS